MWNRLRRLGEKSVRRTRAQGQSLVELAITLPVLLILFLGLIELGMALRAYLVLVNANREAARFAGKGIYTDEQVAQQAMYAFAGQLPARVTGPYPNTGIIITRFHLSADSSEPGTYGTPIYVTGTLTYTSRISPALYVIALKQENDDFNDQLTSSHSDAVRSSHDIVFVEIYYLHQQVLHAPLVEWVFPEPMVLYSRATMRVGSSRVY